MLGSPTSPLFWAMRLGAGVLLLVSILGGPDLLQSIGLGFLGRWGALALWLFVSVWTRASREKRVGGASFASPRRVGAEIVFSLFLLLALLLRWPIAAHDVEHYIGPDEGEVVENVLEIMKTGDPNHRHPGYPGLHFYLQILPASAHLLVMKTMAEDATIPELPRAGFYRSARQWTLLAGLGAAALLFFASRTILSPWGGALAATLLALSPLSFRESAVVNPDLMLMLFATGVLACSLRLFSDRSWRRFVVTGVSVGLTSAIKYTGGATVALLVSAWLLGSTPLRFTRRAVCASLIAVLAFLATSPYTLIHLSEFFRGMSMHFGYYSASELNAPLALSRTALVTGVGLVAGIAALGAALRALAVADRRLLSVLAFPALYLLVFSYFDRAYPRHALVLLPFVALLAADTVERLVRLAAGRVSPRVSGPVLAALLLAGPLSSSVALAQRVGRPSPAERAALWVQQTLPVSSRVLEDQFTPALDPNRYNVRRLRVEESVFLGNYDWVLKSGYPPGLQTDSLREVVRFDTADAFGDTVVAYQVPDRASLMGLTLPREGAAAVLGAGQAAFFGEGWYDAAPSAFGTRRLSRGDSSELFFVLPARGVLTRLRLTLSGSLAVADAPGGLDYVMELNGVVVGQGRLSSDEPETFVVELESSELSNGLNRLLLRYERTARLSRRWPDTALSLYALTLEWVR